MKLSDKLSPAQWEKQYTGRGWSKGTMQETIDNPYTTREAINRTTGNKSTVYYNKDGSYVIRDNGTGKILEKGILADLAITAYYSFSSNHLKME